MKTRILWLYSDKFGCGSYRAYIPALSLEENHNCDSSFFHHTEILPPFPITQLEQTDILVLQRPMGSWFLDYAKEARSRGVRVFYEMDDYLFDIPRHNPAAELWRRKPVQRILQQMIDFVDGVIVSTPPLAERIISHTGRSKADVFVCYNHIHDAVWSESVMQHVTPYHNLGKIVIGWQGSATHESDFRIIAPALKAVIEKYPNVLLRFLGNVPVAVKGLIPDDRFQWTKGVPFERYPSLLRFANFDIGLAPITSSHFNEAKSNLKWLEYSSIGVPCVASRWYPYERSISHGETGFLATHVDEWYEHLSGLVENSELRQRIGSTAKEHVWQEWSSVHAKSWLKAFKIPALSLVR